MQVARGQSRGGVAHPPQHPYQHEGTTLKSCPSLPAAAPGDYSKVVTLALEMPGGWDLGLGAAVEGSAAPYLATAAFGHVPPLLAFAAGAVGQDVDAAEFGRLVQVCWGRVGGVVQGCGGEHGSGRGRGEGEGSLRMGAMQCGTVHD